MSSLASAFVPSSSEKASCRPSFVRSRNCVTRHVPGHALGDNGRRFGGFSANRLRLPQFLGIDQQ